MKFNNNQEIKEFDIFMLHDYDRDRKPGSWVCAGGENLKDILMQLINEICNSNETSKSSIMRLIAKNLNCPFSNVKRVVYRRKMIPLPIILELLGLWSTKLNKSNVEFINKRKELQDSFQILKSNFSLAKPVRAVKKPSVNLAKICGAHAADGWMNIRLRKNGYASYDYTLREEDMKSVIAFRNWIESEFGLECKINNRYRGCYSVEFSNKIFLRYLHLFFGFPCGKKSDIVNEPRIIRNSSLELRKAFALGVMTFDGAVCKKRIELMLKSKNLRDSIADILNFDEIKNIYLTTYPDKFNRWRFYSSRSRKNKEFIKWLDYFEGGTNKYNRILTMIKENHAI